MVAKVSPDRGLVFDGSFRFEQLANGRQNRENVVLSMREGSNLTVPIEFQMHLSLQSSIPLLFLIYLYLTLPFPTWLLS